MAQHAPTPEAIGIRPWRADPVSHHASDDVGPGMYVEDGCLRRWRVERVVVLGQGPPRSPSPHVPTLFGRCDGQGTVQRGGYAPVRLCAWEVLASAPLEGPTRGRAAARVLEHQAGARCVSCCKRVVRSELPWIARLLGVLPSGTRIVVRSVPPATFIRPNSSNPGARTTVGSWELGSKLQLTARAPLPPHPRVVGLADVLDSSLPPRP